MTTTQEGAQHTFDINGFAPHQYPRPLDEPQPANGQPPEVTNTDVQHGNNGHVAAPSMPREDTSRPTEVALQSAPQTEKDNYVPTLTIDPVVTMIDGARQERANRRNEQFTPRIHEKDARWQRNGYEPKDYDPKTYARLAELSLIDIDRAKRSGNPTESYLAHFVFKERLQSDPHYILTHERVGHPVFVPYSSPR